ncbi:hypothetical protein FEF65_00665 [Mariprofundus erugo]|uniref:Uncharacterized protein n=1 Tax=Mariprofundus erugo TaxID=2528639 RepID=A0A5R9GZ72_9PROT|nr:oligosaccharide flippase family protein [Mariprofundus erugo]TLS69042.1 hypothetical protein FEF65_00665 [Mariprofundus erugo]
MIRTFLKDSAIYVVPIVLSRGTGLILLPVYTHFMSSDVYGALELLMLLYALLNLTLPLEITQAVARFLADSSDLKEKQRIASTGYWFTCVVFSIAASVLLVIPEKISQLLFGGGQYIFEVRLAAIAMLFNALQYVVQNQLRWLHEARLSAYVSVIFSMVSAMVSVLALWGWHMGLAGVIYGQIFGSLISLLAGHYLTTRRVPVRLTFDVVLLRKMLLFSAPLVISNVGVYVATFMDRWLLNHLLGLEAVGIYSVAMRFASIVTLGTAVFQMSLTPLIYSRFKEAETPGEIDRIVSQVLLLLVPFIGFLALIAPWLVQLLTGDHYAEAASLVGWLSLVILLMGSYVFFPGLWISGKTKHIAAINLVAALVNLVLNWILIGQIGVFGAVLGTLASAITMCGLYYYYSLKEYHVPYRMWRYLLVLAGLSMFLTLLAVIDSIWLHWIAWLMLCVAAVLLLPHPRDRLWMNVLYRH